jgi:hypothetical protein
MGLLYVLDGGNGFVKPFFPMQFHEIQAQVAVADVTGGSGLEIIVADMGVNSFFSIITFIFNDFQSVFVYFL